MGGLDDFSIVVDFFLFFDEGFLAGTDAG